MGFFVARELFYLYIIMTRTELIQQIKSKGSFLCVGLDTDIKRIPGHLLDSEDPIFEFNKRIIDATEPYCVAYKPNLAFYEAMGPSGLVSLEKTLKYIPDHCFTIADAKRGDIGNTSKLYARAFFEYYNFDSVTVAPYMGEDSVTPFLDFENKWVILLALTSNRGSANFQMLPCNSESEQVYEHVIEQAREWGNPDQLMFVVGATQEHKIHHIREMAPDNFFLVPGVGAQGGDLASVCEGGFNEDIGLLVNSSRGIIYAGEGEDFANAAGEAAKKLQIEMKALMEKFLGY